MDHLRNYFSVLFVLLNFQPSYGAKCKANYERVAKGKPLVFGMEKQYSRYGVDSFDPKDSREFGIKGKDLKNLRVGDPVRIKIGDEKLTVPVRSIRVEKGKTWIVLHNGEPYSHAYHLKQDKDGVLEVSDAWKNGTQVYSLIEGYPLEPKWETPKGNKPYRFAMTKQYSRYGVDEWEPKRSDKNLMIKPEGLRELKVGSEVDIRVHGEWEKMKVREIRVRDGKRVVFLEDNLQITSNDDGQIRIVRAWKNGTQYFDLVE